jgi:NAD(P)-dependent dehydrogenase (short-subunit alcohol dehydrogenase family)
VYAADVAPLGDCAKETGAIAVLADVAVPKDMQLLADAASDARLICLNAGIVGATMGAPWDAPMAEWEQVLPVNLLGVVNGLRAFTPRLIAAREPAHILITASLAGLVTFPWGGVYAATKHALVAVAEQTAMALEDSGIGVTVLCPALVRSGMSAEGAEPLDVARAGLQACNDGTFTVVDEDWTAEVAERGRRLASGTRPRLPQPAST